MIVLTWLRYFKFPLVLLEEIALPPPMLSLSLMVLVIDEADLFPNDLLEDSSSLILRFLPPLLLLEREILL